MIFKMMYYNLYTLCIWEAREIGPVEIDPDGIGPSKRTLQNRPTFLEILKRSYFSVKVIELIRGGTPHLQPIGEGHSRITHHSV
jgi:hypothetical protein